MLRDNASGFMRRIGRVAWVAFPGESFLRRRGDQVKVVPFPGVDSTSITP